MGRATSVLLGSLPLWIISPVSLPAAAQTLKSLVDVEELLVSKEV